MSGQSDWLGFLASPSELFSFFPEVGSDLPHIDLIQDDDNLSLINFESSDLFPESEQEIFSTCEKTDRVFLQSSNNNDVANSNPTEKVQAISQKTKDLLLSEIAQKKMWLNNEIENCDFIISTKDTETLPQLVPNVHGKRPRSEAECLESSSQKIPRREEAQAIPARQPNNTNNLPHTHPANTLPNSNQIDHTSNSRESLLSLERVQEAIAGKGWVSSQDIRRLLNHKEKPHYAIDRLISYYKSGGLLCIKLGYYHYFKYENALSRESYDSNKSVENNNAMEGLQNILRCNNWFSASTIKIIFNVNTTLNAIEHILMNMVDRRLLKATMHKGEIKFCFYRTFEICTPEDTLIKAMEVATAIQKAVIAATKNVANLQEEVREDGAIEKRASAIRIIDVEGLSQPVMNVQGTRTNTLSNNNTIDRSSNSRNSLLSLERVQEAITGKGWVSCLEIRQLLNHNETAAVASACLMSYYKAGGLLCRKLNRRFYFKYGDVLSRRSNDSNTIGENNNAKEGLQKILQSNLWFDVLTIKKLFNANIRLDAALEDLLMNFVDQGLLTAVVDAGNIKFCLHRFFTHDDHGNIPKALEVAKAIEETIIAAKQNVINSQKEVEEDSSLCEITDKIIDLDAPIEKSVSAIRTIDLEALSQQLRNVHGNRPIAAAEWRAQEAPFEPLNNINNAPDTHSDNTPAPSLEFPLYFAPAEGGPPLPPMPVPSFPTIPHPYGNPLAGGLMEFPYFEAGPQSPVPPSERLYLFYARFFHNRFVK